MKVFISILILLLFLNACNNHPGANEETTTSDTSYSVRVVQDTLSDIQLETITRIQAIFSEVYPVSLEETISDFKKDPDRNRQIVIWTKMADAYESYVKSRKEIDAARKKEAFTLILSRTMMNPEQAVANSNLKLLSEQDIREILSYCDF
jgi:PBP1b-binding outer membrane lipoprotein LpoB